MFGFDEGWYDEGMSEDKDQFIRDYIKKHHAYEDRRIELNHERSDRIKSNVLKVTNKEDEK